MSQSREKGAYTREKEREREREIEQNMKHREIEEKR